jgi:hypothetical protein
LAEQSGGELTPAIPTTGAGDAPVQAHAKPAEIRSPPRLDPQSIRFAALRVNQERTLISRQNYKARRTAALAQWRQLGAA